MEQQSFAAVSVGGSRGKREHHGDANYEEEKREDQIGGCPAIPLSVFEWPVSVNAVTGIVHQDHARDGKAAEYVECDDTIPPRARGCTRRDDAERRRRRSR